MWVAGRGDSMQTRAPQTVMTMRHVLSHTSGLSYGGLLAGDSQPVDDVYQKLGVDRGEGETVSSFAEKLSQVPLRYDPGSQWLYSLATDVCGCLVEFISGQKFEHFLKERIFDPLDMQDTAFWVPEDKLDRFAANYGRARDKSLRLLDDHKPANTAKHPAFPQGAAA